MVCASYTFLPASVHAHVGALRRWAFLSRASLQVQELNDHLKTLMPGLSAKVFRTFNASTTLEAELPRDVGHLPLSEKVVLYNEANRKVAILCNHQRTVSAKFNESFAKMQGKRDLLQRQVAELEKMVKRIKKKKSIKLAPTKTPETKEERAQISHLFKRNPSLQQVQNRLKTFSGRLANHTMAMKNKDDNKTVALGTSKINYMDPRITVAWCKQQECDISKVFPKALRDKFPWAMGSDMSFAF